MSKSADSNSCTGVLVADFYADCMGAMFLKYLSPLLLMYAFLSLSFKEGYLHSASVFSSSLFLNICKIK